MVFKPRNIVFTKLHLAQCELNFVKGWKNIDLTKKELNQAHTALVKLNRQLPY